MKTNTPADDKRADAKFLVEEFDLPAEKAANLLTTGEAEHDKLAAETRREERDGNPLAGKPTPQQPAADIVPDNDEQRLKPVIGTQNNRSGGG